MSKKRTAGRLGLLILLASFFRNAEKLAEMTHMGPSEGFGGGGAGARNGAVATQDIAVWGGPYIQREVPEYEHDPTILPPMVRR